MSQPGRNHPSPVKNPVLCHPYPPRKLLIARFYHRFRLRTHVRLEVSTPLRQEINADENHHVVEQFPAKNTISSRLQHRSTFPSHPVPSRTLASNFPLNPPPPRKMVPVRKCEVRPVPSSIFFTTLNRGTHS